MAAHVEYGENQQSDRDEDFWPHSKTRHPVVARSSSGVTFQQLSSLNHEASTSRSESCETRLST
jgi:hypothetical protein